MWIVSLLLVWLFCFASEIYNVNYTLNGHLCNIIEKAFIFLVSVVLTCGRAPATVKHML